MASLYQRLEPVRTGTFSAGVHDRSAYAHLADVMTVPIVLVEFAHLSRMFPLLWQRDDASYAPLALTAVLPGANPLARTGVNIPAPLLWRAYPFAAHMTADQPASARMLVDRASAAEGSISDPIWDDNGRLSERALRAAEALRVACSDRERTREISKAMADHGLLQPWRGALRFRDGDISLAGLLACGPDAEAKAEAHGLTARFGLVVPWLIELHRASLHRLQILAMAPRRPVP